MKAQYKNIEPSMQQLFDYTDGLLSKEITIEIEAFLRKEENEYYRIALSSYKQFYGAEKREQLNKTVDDAYQKLKKQLDGKKDKKRTFVIWDYFKRIFPYGLLILLTLKTTATNNLPKVAFVNLALIAMVYIPVSYFMGIKSNIPNNPVAQIIANDNIENDVIEPKVENITEFNKITDEQLPYNGKKESVVSNGVTNLEKISSNKISSKQSIADAMEKEEVLYNQSKFSDTKDTQETVSLSEYRNHPPLAGLVEIGFSYIKFLSDFDKNIINLIKKDDLTISRKANKWSSINASFGINNPEASNYRSLNIGLFKDYYWKKRVFTRIGINYSPYKRAIQVASSSVEGESIDIYNATYNNADFKLHQIAVEGTNINYKLTPYFSVGLGASFMFDIKEVSLGDTFEPTSLQIEQKKIYNADKKLKTKIGVNPYLSGQIDIRNTGLSLGVKYNPLIRLEEKIIDEPNYNLQSDALFSVPQSPFSNPRLTVSVIYNFKH